MRCLPLLPLVLLAFSPLVHADEGADAVKQGDLAQWVKDLDADDYGTRQAAQQKLEKAGESAIDSVREAALGESQEAASRAIDILRKHSQSKDDAVKNSATAALKQLAEGKNAIVAERAENALKPEADKPDQPQENATPVGPRVIPFGGGGAIPFGGRGGIRIEARAIQIGGEGARKVSIKNADGNKEIDVEEGGRKIKIIESADGHIKLKVEGKKDDMDGSMEVEADSEEDLKKKDPDAHKIYKKYANGGVGGAKIEFRALPAGPRGIRIAPALPRGIPDLPDEQREEVEKRLKEALKRLEAVQEGFDIEAIPANGADARIKALEKIRAQLEKQMEDVQKQIEAAKEE